MTGPIRVVVADDQSLVRAGFVALLGSNPGIEVVGEAANGLQVVEVAARTRPAVVLMDIRMPVFDGIEATRRIRTTPGCEDTQVVVVTTFALDEYVFGAIRAGAAGFILKETPPSRLIEAIEAVASGDALLSPSVTRRLIEEIGTGRPVAPKRELPPLTERETDILRLVAQGLSNRDIAATLYIGDATVKTYVSRLLTKLDCPSRVHLVIAAFETGTV